MKIGKKSWFTVIIGFFIIVVTSISFIYLQRAQEQAQLKEDLISARSRLSSVNVETLTHRKNVLEEDLSQLYVLYEADKEKFVQSIENIAVSGILYSIARANSVNITNVNSSDVFNEEVEGVLCRALALNAKVQGDVDNLVAFITQLNNDLATAVVKSVSIDISTSGNNQMSSADIKMVIYTYEER